MVPGSREYLNSVVILIQHVKVAQYCTVITLENTVIKLEIFKIKKKMFKKAKKKFKKLYFQKSLKSLGLGLVVSN